LATVETHCGRLGGQIGKSGTQEALNSPLYSIARKLGEQTPKAPDKCHDALLVNWLL
jgi:hypothetical protein